MTVQFRLLGPVEVEVAGEIIPLRRRERRLLAILLLHPNRVVPLERLGELLWEEDPPKRLRGAIQSLVSRLRAVLVTACEAGSVELAFAGDGYRLHVDPRSVDAHVFLTLVDQAFRNAETADRINDLRSAVDLWRGPALADAFTGLVRDRLCAELEERRLSAIEELMSSSLALGREREILPELALIAAAHPGREGLSALHMRALYQAGRRVDALAVYARARATLADEFGLDPSPGLRGLHQAILRDELSVPAGAVPRSPAASPSDVRPPAPRTVRPGPIPRQLPVDVPGFAGRLEYLERLDRLLSTVDDALASTGICAIGGTAGVGKTALAVHWAHGVADQFPDGQLYLNLRGFGPVGSPMAIAEAVRAMLDSLQVAPERIPRSLDAQIGLYRSLLAGKRMLVVLDNARDAEQVRPLLPSTAHCLALVTSRHQLTSLSALEGAVLLTLRPLIHQEAHELLAHRLGRQRVTGEPDATTGIIASCTGLPLALAVAAARAGMHPELPLETFARELSGAQGSLDTFDGGDAAASVRSVFSWSYDALSADAARLFRLLGLHPGLDISAPAAASLLGSPRSRTQLLLLELTRSHVAGEHVPGRYTLHDLLRMYAAELTLAEDLKTERKAALCRVLDHYVHSAHNATIQLSPSRDPITLGPPHVGVSPERDVSDPRSALAWFVAEYQVLLAAIEQAVAAGLDTYVWQLAWTLTTFAHGRGDWEGLITVQCAALEAARRLADHSKQAHTHRDLGLTYAKMSRHDDAHAQLLQALGLYRGLADHVGQAHTASTFSFLFDQRGRLDDARRYAQQAQDLYRACGHRIGEARSLSAIGWYSTRLGAHQEAITYCNRAVAIHGELGDLSAQGKAWDTLGHAHDRLGSYRESIACYKRALELHRELGDRYYEAEILARLGDSHQNAGNPIDAQDSWRRALPILEDVRHPDAESVRTKLQGLDQPEAVGGTSPQPRPPAPAG